MSADTTPGRRPSVITGITEEARERSNLQTSVEGLRRRIFIDPQYVKSGILKLRNNAELHYFGDTDKNQGPWSINVSSQEGDTPINLDFGLQATESGELEPFANRDFHQDKVDGDAPRLDGLEATQSISVDFDKLLESLPPAVKTRSGVTSFEVDLDPTKPIVFKSVSFGEGFVDLFGEEALAQHTREEAERAEEEARRIERQTPFLADVNRLRERVNILNPEAYIKKAELYLENGDEIRYVGGSEENPGFWHLTIFQYSKPKIPYFSFGLQLVRDPNSFSYILEPQALVFTPSCQVHASIEEGTTERDMSVVPKIDGFLNEIFPS